MRYILWSGRGFWNSICPTVEGGQSLQVLVTGGCGFLGSHVCEYFREQGWDVVSYDNMTKAELARTGYQSDAVREHNLSFLETLGIKNVRADVRDLDQLVAHSCGCDYIIHTSAQPAMTIGIEAPLEDLSTNVCGTANALEAARRHSIPIVSCATIHVYGNWINDHLVEEGTRFTHSPPEIPEGSPTMRGNLTPLHASKASAEHYVQAYASTYGIRAASFRLTGIYGPRQFGGEDHGWVANFGIRNLIEWPITIFGTGKQVRDIIYATDVARAFLSFYESGSSGVYNIGGGIDHSISLLECIDLIDAATGLQSTVQFRDPRIGDLNYFVCDVARAERDFNWHPTVEPAKGIPLLLEWAQQNLDLFSHRIRKS